MTAEGGTVRGAVVSASRVRAERTAVGATVRTLFGPCAVLGAGPPDASMAGVVPGVGSPGDGRPGGGLGRRLVDIPAQSELAGTAEARGELWFVIEGEGRLAAGNAGPGLRLRADQGVFLPPGLEYSVHVDGPAGLSMDVVTLPAEVGDDAMGADGGVGVGGVADGGGTRGRDAGGATHGGDHDGPATRDLADCEVETTGDRRFRVLFGPGQGCDIATQFVGEIPPGRAPDHSHPYDELVLILDGTGAAHIGGVAHAVSQGTCLHLPPGLSHCLENTGSTTMRVLGVFHPADSPATKLAQH